MSDIDLNLLPDFLIEASEHLEEMEALLLRLLNEPDNLELLNEIFRPAHTVKGGAQFIGLKQISKLAHRLEDLLELLRSGKRSSNTDIADLLIEARDRIVLIMGELSASQKEESSVDDIVDRITAEIEGDDAVANDVTASETTAGEMHAGVESGAESSKAASGTVYQEEHDQELFVIFIDNMRKRVKLLRTQAAELDTAPDPAALLDKCVEEIEQLYSAANYMGYFELTTIYDNWLEDLKTVREMVATGETAPEYFMEGYLTEIISLFPQIEEASEDALEEAEAAAAAAEEAAAVQAATNEAAAIEAAAKADIENQISSGDNDSDIDFSLLPDFLEEAGEHLEEMETLLLRLLDEPDNLELLDEIFRPAHTVKGAAQFIGLQHISKLAHRLEDLLDLLRRGERPSNRNIAELFIEARDRIVQIMGELSTKQKEESSVEDIIERISAEIEGGGVSSAGDNVAEKPSAMSSESAVVQTNAEPAYVEEYDEELFGIFTDNLQEKMVLLEAHVTELENSSDKHSVLEQCIVKIRQLHAAANYMGYDELTGIFDNWVEDILNVQDIVARGETVPEYFMEGYVTEIHTMFPQLGVYASAGGQQAAVSEAAVKQDTEKRATKKQATKKQATKKRATKKGAEKGKEELFEKLTEALDLSQSQGTDEEYEVLHGVFEEMLTDKNPTPDTKQEATPSTQAMAPKQTTPPAQATPPTQVMAPKQTTPPAQATPPTQVMADKVMPETKEADKKVEAKKTPEKGKAEERRKEERRGPERRSGESVLKQSVRVDAEKIDSLINQVGELVVDRAFFFQLFDDMRDMQTTLKEELGMDQKSMKLVRAITYKFGEALASLSRTSNDLQEGVMKVRMLPISQLFNRYPRLVHDLTRNNGKKVNLQLEGEDTELDKMVVEKLSDPLIHIIRNAVDHGLEDPEARRQAGKDEMGSLLLKAYHESNHIVIEVMDDGNGIDIERVKAKAIEKGVSSKEELSRMTPHEIIRLITMPGFSTADVITDTSGRGVGMDVVRQNIEKLNGTLEVESKKGSGTLIRLKIPLTLAIIPAHLIRVAGNMFTIPLANVEETLRISKEETSVIEGTEVIYLRNKTMPIFRLTELFNLESEMENLDTFFVVIVNTGSQKIGLVVDELLGQEEVVIKPLVDYLRESSGFSGATIIGDGSISLILDVYELVNMTSKRQMKRQQMLTRGTKDVGAFSSDRLH